MPPRSTASAASALLAAVFAGCHAAPPADAGTAPEFLASPKTSALATLPFAEAVRVGDLLFVSGQIGNVPGRLELVPGGIAAEADQVMQNLAAVLERHGASLDDAVKCTVFLADMKDWPAFNEIYRRCFHGHFPARSACGCNGLALGARVEVECVACVRRPHP